MMRPKKLDAVRSPEDLGEETLLKQEPAAVAEALTALFPSIGWRREPDGGWFGVLDGEDGRYELRLPSAPDIDWQIHTSHRAATRTLVHVICEALGLVAFDGQAVTLIRPGAGPPSRPTPA